MEMLLILDLFLDFLNLFKEIFQLISKQLDIKN